MEDFNTLGKQMIMALKIKDSILRADMIRDTKKALVECKRLHLERNEVLPNFLSLK